MAKALNENLSMMASIIVIPLALSVVFFAGFGVSMWFLHLFISLVGITIPISFIVGGAIMMLTLKPILDRCDRLGFEY